MACTAAGTPFEARQQVRRLQAVLPGCRVPRVTAHPLQRTPLPNISGPRLLLQVSTICNSANFACWL